MFYFAEQQKMEKNGVIETRTERRTVITRDGDNIDHDKVNHSVLQYVCHPIDTAHSDIVTSVQKYL